MCAEAAGQARVMTTVIHGVAPPPPDLMAVKGSKVLPCSAALTVT